VKGRKDVSVVKIIISAIIIGTVTEIARKSPAFGGAVAALPLVSILSVIWLYDQGEETERISRFVFGVLAGLPATAVLLLVAALALKASFPFWPAILLGIIGWVVFYACKT